MTDKVLVLVDGSIYSESVCRHAAWLAQRLGAPVEAMHVLGRREALAEADPSDSLQFGARTSILSALAGLDKQRAKLAAARVTRSSKTPRRSLKRTGPRPSPSACVAAICWGP